MYGRDERQMDTLADVDFVTDAADKLLREMMETTAFLDVGFIVYFEDAG